MDNGQPKRPPNGGFCWVLVFSGFMISFICDGIVFSFGIVLVELVGSLGMGVDSAALIGSAFNGLMHMAGIVVFSLAEVFNYIYVATAGAALMGVSFGLCLVFNSTLAIVTFYGVLAGLGSCACYISSTLAIANYFDTKKGLAMGIAMSGSCFGGVVLAPLLQYLIHHYGWRGIIKAKIAMSAVCFFLSFTLKKLDQTETQTDDQTENSPKPNQDQASSGEIMSIERRLSIGLDEGMAMRIGVVCLIPILYPYP